MRLANVAGAVALLAAGSGFAASGDPLVVTGNGVNVRSGPGMDNQILTRLNRDREVVEIGRDGEWVRVEIGDSGGLEGWIHGSLLARPAGAPAPADTGTRMQPGETVTVPDQAGGASRATAPDLARAQVGVGVEPAVGPAGNQLEVNRFRESVSNLNSRAQEIAGVSLFTEVQAVDPRTVAVGITDVWTTVSKETQQIYLNTLIDRWSAANGGESPVSVRILGPGGEVLAEKSGP